MAKAIRSYPKSELKVVVARRLTSKDKGLGYWSAVGYDKWVAKQVVVPPVNP